MGNAKRFLRLHQAPNLSWPKATPLLTQLSQKTITQNTSREARTFLFTAIWRRTYGRGPFRQREGKPAAVTTRTTRSDFPISSMGYFLYTLSHRHYSSYLGLWYNSSMGPSWRIDPTTHRTMSERSYYSELYLAPEYSRSYVTFTFDVIETNTVFDGEGLMLQSKNE